MKILIIGGVAGGATSAARLRRLDEKNSIILAPELVLSEFSYDRM